MVRNVDAKKSFVDSVSSMSASAAVETNGDITSEDVRRSVTDGEVVATGSICCCVDRVELVGSANVGATKDGVGCSWDGTCDVDSSSSAASV